MARIVRSNNSKKNKLRVKVELSISSYLKRGHMHIILSIVTIENGMGKVIPNEITETLENLNKEMIIDCVRQYIIDNPDLYDPDTEIEIAEWNIYDIKISMLDSFEEFTSYLIEKDKMLSDEEG